MLHTREKEETETEREALVRINASYIYELHISTYIKCCVFYFKFFF